MKAFTLIQLLASHGQVALNCGSKCPVVFVRREKDGAPDEYFEIDDISVGGDGRDKNDIVLVIREKQQKVEKPVDTGPPG